MEQMLVFVHMSVRIALIALAEWNMFVQTAQENLLNGQEGSKKHRILYSDIKKAANQVCRLKYYKYRLELS